jgi:hypothetical protein
MSAIELKGIAMVERLHGDWKDAVGHLDNEMEVRAHQTEAHASPFRVRRDAGEAAEELEPVVIVPVVRLCGPDAVSPDVEDAGRRVAKLVRHRLPTVPR